MAWFRRVPKGVDLDRELEQAERDVWRAMFETSQEMKPGDEFARGLEARLRSQVRASQAARRAQIRPLAKPDARASSSHTISTSPGGRSTFKGRLSGFAMLAVPLSVLVVVVLGMAVLWRGGLRSTTSTTEVTSGPAGPTRPYSELMQEFLPPGKVRHLVVEQSYTSAPGLNPDNTSQTITGRQEVWLAQGAKHPIMRTQAERPATAYAFTRPVPEIEGFWTVPVVGSSALIDDRFIYENLDEPTVLKHPFASRYLVPFLPSDGELAGFIYESLTRVTGYTTLRGRPVVLLEDLSPQPPVTRRPPNSREPNLYVANTYAALDTLTRQLVQARRVTTFITGKLAGQQATNTYDLLVDELKDASEFAPDFFKLTADQEERAMLYAGDSLFYSPNGSIGLDGAWGATGNIMLPAATDVVTGTQLDQMLSP